MKEYYLPHDWCKALSGEILDIRDGTHDTPKYVTESNHPLVTSKNLKNGIIDLSNIKYISENDFIEIGKRSEIDAGDILFAMIGTIGNPVIIKSKPKFSIKNVGLFKNPHQIITSGFLKLFLDSYTFYSQIEERQFLKGTTQKFIPLGHLRKIYLPLAPLPEQRAIVAKIEQLFSELDNGIANLKAAQDKLDIYRQAVLKKAFEGELTKQWREQQSDLPTADELLEQIKQERQRHYAQQLADWEQAVVVWEVGGGEGKKPKKPEKPTLINKITESEFSTLKLLPNTGLYLKIGELCHVVRGGSPRPAGDERYYNGNIPFLKVADLTRKKGMYVDTYTFTIKEAGLQKTRLLETNTLVISNSGATLGVPKITAILATANDGIAAFLGLSEPLKPYLFHFWNSKTKELRNIDQGAAQPNLNSAWPVMLFP